MPNAKNVTVVKGKRKQKKNNKQPAVIPASSIVTVSNIMTPKQRQNDVRRQTAAMTEIDLKNQTKQIAVNVNQQAASFNGIAAAYVSLALARGFLATSINFSQPYWAYVYMVKVLISFAVGKPLPVPKIPMWLLCYCNAISPKNVPFQQGNIGYSFNLDDASYAPSASTFLTGYVPYASRFTFNYPDNSTLINKFPASLPPDAYPPGDNDASGQAAFAALISYMLETTIRGKRSAELVEIGMKTPFGKCAAPFAQGVYAQGQGFNNTGGWVTQAWSEVPIFEPAMCMTTTQASTPAQVANRFYNINQQVAGDPFWLGCSLSTWLKFGEMKKKRPTRFAAINFLEFANVLAFWVTKVVQAQFNDPEYTNMIASLPGGELDTGSAGIDAWPFILQVPDPRCPITLLEMQLLLRNVIISAFKETQAGVQSLLPREPVSGSVNEFTPYLVSANTCPLTSLDMLLPMALVENIRTLIARKVQCNKKKNTDIQDYVPVLGQYFNDVLVQGDYEVNLNNAKVPAVITLNVFKADTALYKRQVEIKGKMVVQRVAETALSLVDGTDGATPVFINDPMRLKTLVALWNDWVNGYVQTYSMPMVIMGTELGISTLTSIGLTRHWIDPAPSVLQGNLEYEDERVTARKSLSSTPFNAKLAILDSSQSTYFGTAYEQVLNTWILPTNYSKIGVSFNDQSDVIRWQELSGQPFGVATTDSVDGVMLNQLHDSYASKMIKGRNGPSSGWTDFFVQQASLGRGGILSGIGAALDGILGI